MSVRLANIGGRAKVLVNDGAVDLHAASGGLFPADIQSVYGSWEKVRKAAEEGLSGGVREPYVSHQLESPIPRPRQIFAIGLNYSEHARESGFAAPQWPVVFTKFASSICAPISDVRLPRGSVDWEAELVAVIGIGGRHIAEADAWSHVAGLTVGQDISERNMQHSGPAPQFSLAKSHENFSPTGPVLVTPDEFADPDDLAIECAINGQVVQSGRTSQMIFPVARLIALLSTIVELYPGDAIFTGTPAGVGAGRTPPRYLSVGDVLTTEVAGIGQLRQTFVQVASAAV